MQCLSCKNKRICEIYSLKKKHEGDVVISVSNCSYCPNISNENTVEKEVNTVPTFDFSDSFDEEEYKKMISTVEEVKEDKTLMVCSTCGGTDYAEHLGFCSKCGREVCGNCATNEDGLTYCEKCWEEV